MTNTNVTVDDLFIIQNGIATTGLNIFDSPREGLIPFVRPSSTQARTISGWIDPKTISSKKIFPKDTLFVSTNGEGSHTFSYVSSFEFSANSDVSVLIPKKDMTLNEKLYYAKCITSNRYKFSYGRKPKGKRLKSIEIPPKAPSFVNDPSMNSLEILRKVSKTVSDKLGKLNRSEADQLNFDSEFIKVSDLFDIKYGHGLELKNMTPNPSGVNFVSRTSKNNGIAARVLDTPGLEKGKAGTITVAVSGSVMESFVQLEDYYTAFHVMILSPKVELSLEEKLFYCSCLRANGFRFNYGRQANKSLPDLLIPSPHTIPDSVYGALSNIFKGLTSKDK